MSKLSPAFASRWATPDIRRLLAWHPEWWALAISAGAWLCVFLNPGTAGCCSSAGWPATHSGGLHVWTIGLADWLLMVLGMMLPLMIIPIRITAFGSLWRRRHWAVAAFLLSYVSIWVLAGVATLSLLALVHAAPVKQYGWVAAAALLITAAWHSTSLKRRLSVACHRTSPLAPDGWPAHRDCLKFGADHGIYCVGNCGMLMLASMLSPWPETMMIAATLLLLYERYRAKPHSRVPPVILGLFAFAQCL